MLLFRCGSVSTLRRGLSQTLIGTVIAQGKVPGLSKQTDLFADGLGHAKKPLENMASYRKLSSATPRHN
jgi:hypothetical protein